MTFVLDSHKIFVPFAILTNFRVMHEFVIGTYQFIIVKVITVGIHF